MKIVLLPRSAGKTTKMMEWLTRKQNRILIVFSLIEKDRITRLYGLDEKVAERIMTFHEYMKKPKSKELRESELGIDNADMVFQSFFESRIDAISITQTKNQEI